MIYFLQDEVVNLIKIGFTDDPDPRGRLRALQTGSPVRLALLCALPGTQADESALHRQFADARDHGEWFRPVPSLVLFVAANYHRRLDLAGESPRPRDGHFETGRPPKARLAALVFLHRVLAGGPARVSEVRRNALGEGLSWPTVERAKRGLGVVTSRVGGRRYWSLPATGVEQDAGA